MKNTAIAVAFSVLVAGTVGASVAPAFAQDRTPPTDSPLVAQPQFDMRPGQVFVTQGGLYGINEGRSVGYYYAPAWQDQGVELDR